MRRVSPDLRTLPSSTFATLRVFAISAMPASLPLNANDDVRAMTRIWGTWASRFSNSSDNPSEKYSWSFVWLMSTNGSTAIELSLAAGAAEADDGADALVGAGVVASPDETTGSALRGLNRSNANSPIA